MCNIHCAWNTYNQGDIQNIKGEGHIGLQNHVLLDQDNILLCCSNSSCITFNPSSSFFINHKFFFFLLSRCSSIKMSLTFSFLRNENKWLTFQLISVSNWTFLVFPGVRGKGGSPTLLFCFSAQHRLIFTCWGQGRNWVKKKGKCQI